MNMQIFGLGWFRSVFDNLDDSNTFGYLKDFKL